MHSPLLANILYLSHCLLQIWAHRHVLVLQIRGRRQSNITNEAHERSLEGAFDINRIKCIFRRICSKWFFVGRFVIDGFIFQKLKKDGAFSTLMKIFGNDGKEALAALKLAQKLQPAGRYCSFFSFLDICWTVYHSCYYYNSPLTCHITSGTLKKWKPCLLKTGRTSMP